jgi:hypothetical protein
MADELDVMTCAFETLLALEDQMPRERWEQIKISRPDFARWLDARRAVGPSDQTSRDINQSRNGA